MRYQFLVVTIVFFVIKSVSQNKEYEVVVSDLTNPWGFTFLPDNSMLITEKEGKLIHFKNDRKTEIKNLPEIYVRWQGGFMDICLLYTSPSPRDRTRSRMPSSA